MGGVATLGLVRRFAPSVQGETQESSLLLSFSGKKDKTVVGAGRVTPTRRQPNVYESIRLGVIAANALGARQPT